MLIKIELTGLIAALMALISNLFILFNWENLDTSTQDFFRGGEPGGIITGVLLITGFVASILYIFNVLTERRKLWGLRLIIVLTFFVGVSILGNML